MVFTPGLHVYVRTVFTGVTITTWRGSIPLSSELLARKKRENRSNIRCHIVQKRLTELVWPILQKAQKNNLKNRVEGLNILKTICSQCMFLNTQVERSITCNIIERRIF